MDRLPSEPSQHDPSQALNLNMAENNPFAAIRAERAENQRHGREDPEALAAKIRAELPLTNCAMCRVEFRGYGHNAQPIIRGFVCDDCNVTVLRQRMR